MRVDDAIFEAVAQAIFPFARWSLDAPDAGIVWNRCQEELAFFDTTIRLFMEAQS